VRAIRIHGFADIDSMRFPGQCPGAGEVLVTMKASDVGLWDRLMREGRISQALPLTCAWEVSDTVAAFGARRRGVRARRAIYGGTNDQFVDGYAECALVEAGRSRPSPPRSPIIGRRAFRSSPSPRGRCCSGTRGSDWDKRSLVRGAAGSISALRDANGDVYVRAD
jgi:NADPH:quinone reductase-like Zn-dependent oxidoreductase